MKSKDPCFAEISIEAAHPLVLDQYERSLRKKQRQTEVQGYRKGRAPLSKIRELFGQEIEKEVVDQLVAQTLTKAIEREGLIPVTKPKIIVEEFSYKTSLRYRSGFEVKPKISPLRYTGLKLKKSGYTQSSEIDIDKEINHFLISWSNLTEQPNGSSVQMGDLVKIDIAEFLNGKLVPGSRRIIISFEVGHSPFGSDFDKALIGLKKQEFKKIKLKNTEYRIKIHDFFEINKPQLNDHLIATKTAYKNIDQWKQQIRKELDKKTAIRASKKDRLTIIDELLRLNSFDCPKGLALETQKQLYSATKNRLLEAGLDLPEVLSYLKNHQAEMTQTALSKTKAKLILEAIAQDLKMSCSKEEIDTFIYNKLNKRNVSALEQLRLINDPMTRAKANDKILAEKVLNHLFKSTTWF